MTPYQNLALDTDQTVKQLDVLLRKIISYRMKTPKCEQKDNIEEIEGILTDARLSLRVHLEKMEELIDKE